jgi:hypothetical protein
MENTHGTDFWKLSKNKTMKLGFNFLFLCQRQTGIRQKNGKNFKISSLKKTLQDPRTKQNNNVCIIPQQLFSLRDAIIYKGRRYDSVRGARALCAKHIGYAGRARESTP